MHGITDKDVKGAPTPEGRGRASCSTFVGDALVVGHNVGFDLGFIEEAKGDGFRFEPGRYLDTLVIAREGYPGARIVQARRPGARSSASSSTQSHRALPDAEATANLLLWFANDLPGRISTLRDGDRRRGPRPAAPVATPTTLLEAARREARVSKSLFSLRPEEDGPPRSSSTRASGSTAAA